MDADRFPDHVVVPRGPRRAPLGPARRRRAEWSAAAATLGIDVTTPLGVAAAQALRRGWVIGRGHARELGLSDAQVRGLVRRGEWTAPRRGVLCPLPAQIPAGGAPRSARTPRPIGGAAAEIAATAATLARPGSVVSHASAALLHGLPLLAEPVRPTLTATRRPRTCDREDVRIYAAALRRVDLDSWFGALTTSVARTVVDLARSAGLADGLVAADAALREQLTTTGALADAARYTRGWPGGRRAQRIVALADGLAESPLESIIRLRIHEAGLPPPELQVWIDTAGGRYRVDMAWRARRVVLEADGLLKYRDDPAALTAEKRRQEHLERSGYRVVRVLWADIVRQPAETVARIAAALG